MEGFWTWFFFIAGLISILSGNNTTGIIFLVLWVIFYMQDKDETRYCKKCGRVYANQEYAEKHVKRCGKKRRRKKK